MSKHIKIGIIGAMMEEIKKLEEHTQNQKKHFLNKYITVTEGTLEGREIAFAASNIGKTFASSVCTTLIQKFGCQVILFTGVAGGLSNSLEIGDIVIAKDLIDYDFNCKNFFNPMDPNYKYKLGEIPFCGLCEYECDVKLVELALKSVISQENKLHVGRIATGSEFLTQERKRELKPIWEEIGTPLGVEMEGSAVAQICKVYDIPFLAIRAISDKLEGDANHEFNKFVQHAADNTFSIIDQIVKHL